MDEPSADPSAVALYFVDQEAAKRVKAVLSGEGADEFFGGYRIYQTPFANAKLSWAPKGLLKGASKAARALGVRGANYLERASERPEDWYYTNANGVAFSPAAVSYTHLDVYKRQECPPRRPRFRRRPCIRGPQAQRRLEDMRRGGVDQSAKLRAVVHIELLVGVVRVLAQGGERYADVYKRQRQPAPQPTPPRAGRPSPHPPPALPPFPFVRAKEHPR